jgi:glycerophosphoryl diester phosphodiesterase
MRSKHFVHLAVAALIYSVTMTAAAQDTSLSEDFTGAALPAKWEAVSGKWQVADGKLRGVPADTKTAAKIALPYERWDAFVLEADVSFEGKADKGASWAVMARESQSGERAFRFGVRVEGRLASAYDLAVYSRVADDKTEMVWRTLQTASALSLSKAAETRHLKLEIAGQLLRVSLDGEKVLESLRADEFAPTGRIAFVVTGATLVIDNVKVSALEPEKVALPQAGHPMVIAHRGWSYIAPENTIASYRKALTTAADMFECDTYLTSDNVAIVLHDGTFRRTAGVNKKPRELTLAQVKELDAGKWKAAEYAGEKVPTLKELLEFVKDKRRLVIELKEHGIGQQVLDTIKASGTNPEDVMMFSFYLDAVEEITKLEPLLPASWLIGDLPYREKDRREIIRQALRARMSCIGLPMDRVDPEFVRWAQRCGLSVFVWTVDEPQDMRYLIRIGVDAIITNRPDVACNLLKNGAK